MKAVVLRKAFDLASGNVATPEPEPDEVLVRVTHSGICGTDLKIFTGAHAGRVSGHHGSRDGRRSRSTAPTSPAGVGDRVLVDPVLFCGACFDCRAGRTNLCPNGAVIGREVERRLRGLCRRAPQPRLPAAAVDRQPHRPAHPGADDGAARAATSGREIGSPGETQSVAVIGLGVSGQLHVQLAKARGAHTGRSASRAARGSEALPSGSARI